MAPYLVACIYRQCRHAAYSRSLIFSLNYSETYFELVRKPLTVIIVTLSVVCTLKGMSRWSIQRIKAMLLWIVYAMFFVNTVNMRIKACNVLNAMFVDTVDTGVCGFYTTLYTEKWGVKTVLLKWPLAPAKREAYLKSLPSCGFSCSTVQGGSFIKRFLSCIDSIDVTFCDHIQFQARGPPRDPCID